MKTQAATIFITCFLGFGLLSVADAQDVEIVVTSDPIETGSGSNLKARYQNVATVDGTSIDLLGEVLSQSTNKTNDFWQGGVWALPGDFVFSFNNMVIGEPRSATVRWSFVESGTNTPVYLSEFSVTLDDLDDKASGGDGRTETVTATDAISYTVDSATNLSVNASVNDVSVTGGSNQDPGDVGGAITFHYANISTFTMTYQTVPRGATNSAFHHDGHGTFVFDDPDETKLPVSLLYTYYFTNQEDDSVTIDFSDTLPAGLVWDTGFTPHVNGPFSGGTPEYSGGNSTVSITGLILDEESSGSITFSTLDTLASGTIENEASIVPTDPSGPSQSASASITLP